MMTTVIMSTRRTRTVTAAATAVDELPPDKIATGVEVIVDVISFMEEEDVEDFAFELLVSFSLPEEKKRYCLLQVKYHIHY